QKGFVDRRAGLGSESKRNFERSGHRTGSGVAAQIGDDVGNGNQAGGVETVDAQTKLALQRHDDLEETHGVPAVHLVHGGIRMESRELSFIKNVAKDILNSRVNVIAHKHTPIGS